MKNGARYAQLYAGWKRHKTVYLDKDVNEVASRIVSATAELGRTAKWTTAKKKKTIEKIRSGTFLTRGGVSFGAALADRRTIRRLLPAT